MKIDAHQHFWIFDPVRDAWITPEMGVIRRNFLPDDLKEGLAATGVDGTVAVQADQSKSETEFLLGLADTYDFIKGVVGWTDFFSDELYRHLEFYSQFEKLKGFRHIVQAEPAGFLRDPAFIRGVRQLSAFDFTYDLLVYPHQLEESVYFASLLPSNRLIIDHIAKPYIREDKGFEEWKKQMTALAGFPNIYCKVSGMVTEADWNNWQPETFTRYLDHILEAFGTDRIVFGSDWPVCLVAASYSQVNDIVEEWAQKLTVSEREKLFGLNAVNFYSLE